MSDSFTSNRDLEKTILGPDPRFTTRMVVRGVLGTQGGSPSEALLSSFREWPEMVHVWHLMFQVLPEAREAIREIGRFIKVHTRAG